MGRPSPSPHAALLPLLLLAALSCAAASGRPLPKVFKAELEGPGLGISTGTPVDVSSAIKVLTPVQQTSQADFGPAPVPNIPRRARIGTGSYIPSRRQGEGALRNPSLYRDNTRPVNTQPANVNSYGSAQHGYGYGYGGGHGGYGYGGKVQHQQQAPTITYAEQQAAAAKGPTTFELPSQLAAAAAAAQQVTSQGQGQQQDANQNQGAQATTQQQGSAQTTTQQQTAGVQQTSGQAVTQAQSLNTQGQAVQAAQQQMISAARAALRQAAAGAGAAPPADPPIGQGGLLARAWRAVYTMMTNNDLGRWLLGGRN